MPREALPCIACGNELNNAFHDMTNQPSDGTAFESSGHYGSTAFDPMDGSYIEINVCDRCLVAAREKGRVLRGMHRKMVLCEGTIVGWAKALRPLLPWTGDEDQGPEFGEDRLVVEIDAIGDHKLYPEIDWQLGAIEWARGERERAKAPCGCGHAAEFHRDDMAGGCDQCSCEAFDPADVLTQTGERP